MLLISPQHTFPEGLVSKLQELGADIMYDTHVEPGRIYWDEAPDGSWIHTQAPRDLIIWSMENGSLKPTESKPATEEVYEQCWVSEMAPQCHNGEWWYLDREWDKPLHMHKIPSELWPYMEG